MLVDLLNLESAGPILQKQLPQLHGHAVELSLRDVWLRDDWSVQYQLQFNGGSYLLTALKATSGDFEAMEQRVRRQAERTELGGLIASLPKERVLIFPFPLDPKIKRLSRMADSGQVTRKMREYLPSATLSETCVIEALRYIPGKRCQMAFHWNGFSVLGKMFRDDRGLGLYDDMLRVREVFAACGDPELIAPRALGSVPEWCMVLQEMLPGKTLHDLLLEGNATKHHMTAAARSLAVLQHSSIQPAGTHAMAAELALIQKCTNDLRSVDEYNCDFAEVYEQIEKKAAHAGSGPLVPVHRDFYDKQLIHNGSQTALIDLDTLAWGHSEIDAANFAAHLRLRSLQGFASVADAELWSEWFLEQYHRLAAKAVNEELLRFYSATVYFRLACKNRLREDGDRASGELLKLAAQCFSRAMA